MANTPDRWAALRVNVAAGFEITAEAVSRLLAERDALAIENRALREALRDRVIGVGEFNAECDLCGLHWSKFDSTERHESYCLARQKE